ncbi:hypothetical protein [Flavobacterium sp.]|uniref:hypothetical protein n=1 Tax=Flavobacterium sp. TaxID=239 RepID=UPI0039E53800
MKKRITVFLIVLASLILICSYWENIAYKLNQILPSAGSYPFAEQFELNFSNDKAIKAVKKFKEIHPEYKVPNITINNQRIEELNDGKNDRHDHWYHIYFYYKEKNEIVNAYLRGGENSTTLAIVSINKGLDIGNWKDINRDYILLENKEKIKEFEIRIVNEIKLILKENKL